MLQQQDQIALSVTVLGEARELLSALRRNRRFGYLLSFATQSQPAEHPLVKEVKGLRDIVRSPIPSSPSNQASSQWTSNSLILPEALLAALQPFFEVVKSRDASGLITGVALQSLCRISQRLIVLAESNSLLSEYAPVFSAFIDVAAQCRFDATDPASDEVVLARITAVISTVANSVALPFLSDASIIRSVEACLGIASGRRRASDLLKRTADAALMDIFSSLGSHICSLTTPADQTFPRSAPHVIVDRAGGPAFGYNLDSDAFQQHGPASVYAPAALLDLCSRMADPSFAETVSERLLGMQLVSAMLLSAGTELRRHELCKNLLLRNCCRAVLRSLGLFQSPPSLIASSFTIAIQLVHILQEAGIPFLLALLERVYPYYISGYENVLPRTEQVKESELSGNGALGKVATAGPVPASISNGSVETKAIELDPVIREIGLESLAALLSTPGLLCLAYRFADCEKKKTDVVRPLMKALGHSSKTKRLRRRSKRLRASSSGSNRISDVSDDPESEEEDDILSSGTVSSETSRFTRAAALLCAESVLAVIDTISDRLKLETAGLARTHVTDDEAYLRSYRLVRKEKMRLQQAAEIFNSLGKMGKASELLKMLRERGLARSSQKLHGTVSEDLDHDVRALVKFLAETPNLSKERIGQVLGEPDSLSRRVLSDYTGTFEFKDRAFTESLRVYLESFRLPGEAQKIDRIVESFANSYFAQNQPDTYTGSDTVVEQRTNSRKDALGDSENGGLSGSVQITESQIQDVNSGAPRNFKVLRSAEAAYVLSFSVVMLNTDQHNDSIRKKMSFEDFAKNCRGINDSEDLPRWFLSEVFESIAAVEIRMSDEAGIGALTDLLWDEQIKEAGLHHGVPSSVENSRVFDEDLFLLSWEAGVVAANSILNEAGDANSVQKALEGFLSVARCATSYRIGRPTDAVISSLCTATTLRDGPLFGAISRFGTDIKAQMASVALSGVSRQCGDCLQADGWQALVAYLLRLHALCLLPTDLERHLGGYGLELVNIQKQPLTTSEIIPSWWPSRSDLDGSATKREKPKKSLRTNGFFAAILAASIGTDVDSEEEEYDQFSSASDAAHPRRKTSTSIPHYLRMQTQEDSEAQDLARKCIAGCRIEDVVINEAKVLQSSALEYLAKAIASSAGKVLDSTDGQGSNQETAEVEDAAALLESSVLDWSEIAPPSPRGSSSIIAGVSHRHQLGTAADGETDYTPLTLSSPWDGSIRDRDERKAREFVVSFCLDVLCELTLQNRDRLHIPWPSLHSLIVRILAPATHPTPVLERSVVALLRVGVRLLHREELRDDVLRGLNLLVRLPSDTACALSIPVAAGVCNMVNAHGSAIQSTSGWHAILSILENTARCNSEAREIGLETLSGILKDQPSSEAVSAETFAPLLDAILAFVSCTSVDTAIQALELLFILSERLSVLTKSEIAGSSNSAAGQDKPMSSRSEGEVWSEYWGPLFLGFASAIRDSRGKVRNAALGVLERVVASGGSAEFLSATQWSNALSNVILPLMNKLFSTQGFFSATVEAERAAQKKLFAERRAALSSGRGRSRSFLASPGHDEQLLRSVAAACNRTRMRAVMLTSKTFLQHHMAIANGIPEEAFTQLWIGVLEVFRVAVESGMKEFEELRVVRGESRGTEVDDVAEHVPENVKNLLLVMCDCGLLTPSQELRWSATFSVVRDFVPDVDDIIKAATGAVATSLALEIENPIAMDAISESEKDGKVKEAVNCSTMEPSQAESSVPVASTT